MCVHVCMSYPCVQNKNVYVLYFFFGAEVHVKNSAVYLIYLFTALTMINIKICCLIFCAYTGTHGKHTHGNTHGIARHTNS